MKAVSLLLAALLGLAATTAQAQYQKPNRIFKKGQTDVLVGIGVVPTFMMDNAKALTLPFSMELNRMLGDRFSLGAATGFSAYESQPILQGDGVEQRVVNKHFQFALKGAIHPFQRDNSDWYGGFQLAWNLSLISPTNGGSMDFMKQHLGIEEKNGKLTWTGFVGYRHAFHPKWSAFAEAGFGISILTTGVSLRL